MLKWSYKNASKNNRPRMSQKAPSWYRKADGRQKSSPGVTLDSHSPNVLGMTINTCYIYNIFTCTQDASLTAFPIDWIFLSKGCDGIKGLE